MSNVDLVKTGVGGLDAILSDGIPRGNIILVEGSIGTGKTTLGVEFIYRGAVQFGEPGLIVLFEVSPDKLARDAAEFGWDLAALEASGQLKIIFTTRQVFRQEMQHADSAILDEATKIGARRLFVDGASSVLSANPAEEPRDAFHLLVEGLQRERLTTMLGVEIGAGHHNLPEEAIADTVIRLRMEDMSRATVRSIEIIKSRGHDFQMGRHSFRIEKNHGVQVYRRVQAPRSRDHAAAFDPTTRVSTGIPGLDDVVNGGYFLGSTTVVSGISGVGKSVMALQYLAEGARLGERTLMFSLDEQVAQIVRNAATIGVDLQAHIDRGVAQVHYEPPQEMEVDRHFYQIERLVQEFKPRRVVFDSISTYGSSLGTKERVFRDFFHAVVALMKEAQTATIYNHENPEMLGMSSMMGEFAMSSLVDNIILMNWIELGDVFRLGLTVAKMRANATTRVTHECEILNGEGMRVLPRRVPAGLVRSSFSQYTGLISRSPVRHADEDAK